MEDAFGQLAQELGNVSRTLSAQGISQTVKTFDGNPKNFREWIKSIDKYALLTNLHDDRKKDIAFQASNGAVSGYIRRYTLAHNQCTWNQLRQELAKRFSDVTDPQYALTLLRNTRQKVGENIQIYAERLLSLAEEAYLGQQLGDGIERQLIDIFTDGLTNTQLKMKIFRDRPDTLQGAISIATTEQNLRNRVSLSDDAKSRSNDTETPMEVDHYRHIKCFKCKKYGHTSRKCKTKNVNTVGYNQNRQTNRQIRCYGCGQIGHIVRFCRQKESSICQREGHEQRNQEN